MIRESPPLRLHHIRPLRLQSRRLFRRHQHRLQPEHVIRRHPVFQAVRPARVERHIAADRTDLLARRIRREVQPVRLRRRRHRQIDHARLDDRDALRRVHQQSMQLLDLIQAMNKRYLEDLETDQNMEGMIESFEIAFRMQAEAPSLLDLTKETTATLELYGVNEKETDNFGRQCLLARRMVEAGVRFVQITDGGWDHHGQIRKGLPQRCKAIDRPIAGLLTDLRSRGLLDDTLLVWSGEFGRTPFEQDLSEGKAPASERGREHNPKGFTAWMAGAGIRGGITYGETDEYAWEAVEGKTHIHDLHATVLHLLGIDHERLTYRYMGRDFRLTDVFGRVVKDILS